MSEPLKDKILQYEQDYIESSIKWNLELGDDIFKKTDIISAVKWLKKKISDEIEWQEVNRLIMIIDTAFPDLKKHLGKSIISNENYLPEKKQIEKARKRIKAGKFITEQEAKKMLGV